MSSHYEEMTPLAISVKKACRLMDLSRSTIYRLQGTDRFPAIRKGAQNGRSYVLYAEVVEWSQSLGRIVL
jgi:predicted DNA-binding transcriptional regulator AlpA